MSQLNSLVAVLSFELRRTMTWRRVALWISITAFSPLIMFAYVVGRTTFQRMELAPDALTAAMYALIPEVSCSIGLLLWMAPAVHSELEAKTWVYLAVRPYGRRTVLLGKYLMALLWSISSALAALMITVPLMKFYQPALDLTRNFLALLALAVIASLGRGAIYAIFAAVLPQRAMVFAFAYTIIFEYFVGFIPAIINQLTVQFHMRCLLFRWMEWNDENPIAMFVDQAPVWQHLLALAAYVAIVLPSAILILEQRQFPSSEEG
jgi:ABC-type transport system involved in multi-copper enzyme maturation permease subunit